MEQTMQHMTFVQAVSALKILTPADSGDAEHRPFMRRPDQRERIVVETFAGKGQYLYEVRVSDWNGSHNVHCVPYSPTVADVFADDWGVWE